MTRAVLVKSCRKFRARREACEMTWAGELRSNGIPVFFVEGGYEQATIAGDLICTASGDGYNDNSFKVRDAIEMLLAYRGFDSLFICDDNTFVQWRRWLAFDPPGEFVGLNAPPTISWAHGGAGFYLSRRCCELFIAGIKRRCSWDDKLASEILGQHGVALTNFPEYFAQWTERVSADNWLITCHNVSEPEMRTLFRETYDLAPVYKFLSRQPA